MQVRYPHTVNMPANILRYLNARELHSLREELAQPLSPNSSLAIALHNREKVLTSHKKLRTAFNYQQEMEQIDLELAEQFKFTFISPTEAKEFANQLASSRFSFLIYKRIFLIGWMKHKQKINALAKAAEDHEPIQNKHLLLVVLNILKKIADILDDVWNTIRGFLALKQDALVKLGPYLTGGTGFFIHTMEGYEGATAAVTAYADETTPQRKTRIAAGMFTTGLATIGACLSIALIAGTLGAPVAGLSLMQVTIPGLLTSIYVIALVRNIYITNSMKERVDKTTSQLQEVLQKLNQCNESTPTDEYFTLLKKNAYLQNKLAHYKTQLTMASQKTFFKSVEVAGSLIVLVGTVLSTSALLGTATVASFGLVPVTILVIGVAIGLLSKWREAIAEEEQAEASVMADTALQEAIQPATPSSYRVMLNAEKTPGKGRNITLAMTPSTTAYKPPAPKGSYHTADVATLYATPQNPTKVGGRRSSTHHRYTLLRPVG